LTLSEGAVIFLNPSKKSYERNTKRWQRRKKKKVFWKK
jgi:hypothetical protein